MRDFFEILNTWNLYDEKCHNKTDNTYILNGNLVEFMSMDQPQKKRGAKRNFLWLNEANEFTFEDFQQLVMRTTEDVDIDYNPSDEFHWIYDRLLTRPDVTFIKSTYKDNPFLPQSLIDEIEYLKEVDENYWRVYGLGERGTSKSIIYPTWHLVDAIPDFVDEIVYGVDFGFNNPTTVLAVGIYDKRYLYIDELVYETRLTNRALIDRLNEFKVPKTKVLKCDCEDPARIEEIRMAGFNAQGCMKGKNSVKNGIDKIKRHSLYVTKRSVNVIKELKSYKWKEDANGHVLDEPVKFNDHGMDALRYACGDINTIEIKFREIDL
jgi:phage terminase large subunit